MKYWHEYRIDGLFTGRYCLAPDPLPDLCFIIYEPLITVNGVINFRYLPTNKIGDVLFKFGE